MNYGFTRVSTDYQSLETQAEMIKKVCPDVILRGEKISGSSESPVLGSLIDEMVEGDTLYIYKLDRLSRSLSRALKLIFDVLIPKGVKLVSLNDHIDTSTASGRTHLKIMLAIADGERDMISERTKHKLALLKEQGKQLGRPRKAKLSPEMRVFLIKKMSESKRDWTETSRQFKESFGVDYSPNYLRILSSKLTDKRMRYRNKKRA